MSDLAASVLARLRNVARERGEDPQLVLVRYADERLLNGSPCRRPPATSS
jgi:hypothetical protein